MEEVVAMGKKVRIVLFAVMTIICLCLFVPKTVNASPVTVGLEQGSIRSADGSEVFYANRGRTEVFDVLKYELSVDIEGRRSSSRYC